MKTDDLIKLIAEDASTQATPMGRRLAAATAAGCVLAAMALVSTIGVRSDIWTALGTWRFDAKVMSVVAVLVGAWGASRHLSRPEADPRKALLYIAAPAMLLVLAVGVELASTPAATWGVRAIGSNARLCLVAILAFAAAPLVVLLAVLRGGAPSSPPGAGGVAGLLAGAIGALFYAIHCPDDSPLFVALWYTPPILMMAAVGGLVGSRALRW